MVFYFLRDAWTQISKSRALGQANYVRAPFWAHISENRALNAVIDKMSHCIQKVYVLLKYECKISFVTRKGAAVTSLTNL